MTNQKTEGKRIVCPKCKGNGYHKEPHDGMSILLAPLTFGISLCNRKKVNCRVCDSAGYIENKFSVEEK